MSVPRPLAPSATFAVVTMGCPKNEADSDRARGAAQAGGPQARAARAAPTSSWSTPAASSTPPKQESIDVLLDVCEAAHARGARVAAYGCLVDRHRDELRAELPEVDVCLRPSTRRRCSSCSRSRAGRGRGARPGRRGRGRRPAAPAAPDSRLRQDLRRLRPALLRSAPSRSSRATTRPSAPAQMLRAARAGLAAGARELVLVGQDTSRWALARLRRPRAACWAICGPWGRAVWLRLLYLQPDGSLRPFSRPWRPTRVPYVDLPLQHASGAVLRRHGALRRRRRLSGAARPRAGAPAAGRRALDLHHRVPGRDRRRRRGAHRVHRAPPASPSAGVFVFDAQEGTPAAGMPGQVPAGSTAERAARVGDVVDRAPRARTGAGSSAETVDVLVERGSRGVSSEATGRIAQQAPDVDGLTYVAGARARRGQVVRALVSDVAGYHLLAQAVT